MKTIENEAPERICIKDLTIPPLNPEKQTILRVKSFVFPGPERLRTGITTKKDLLITVVDEFNRITVEEIVKTQTK
ncbi:MAG: hypothetical protein AB1606_04390 [Nitrospirota bacterium]